MTRRAACDCVRGGSGIAEEEEKEEEGEERKKRHRRRLLYSWAYFRN